MNARIIVQRSAAEEKPNVGEIYGDRITPNCVFGLDLLVGSVASGWCRIRRGAGGNVRSFATLLSCCKRNFIGWRILFRLPQAKSWGSVCGRDMRTGEQDSPYGEAPTLGSGACGCCPGVFPILRRQISCQTCCRSTNLFGNSPNRRVKDHGYGLSGLLWRDSAKAARNARSCESRSAVPGWFGNSAIRLLENRYQQADRSCERYGVQGSGFEFCARIRRFA